MTKESKLPKSKAYEQSTGDVKDMVTKMGMSRLAKTVDKDHFNKFSKSSLTAQKEKQIEKYTTGI